jgi:hypothetical protein
MNHSTGSAASVAFAIPEILENVLRHLSNRDMLRAKRTSKFFDAVVEGSKLIQEDLFLQPRSTGPRCINDLIFIFQDVNIFAQGSVAKRTSDQVFKHGPFQIAVWLTDELFQLDDQAKVLNMLVTQPVVPVVTARAVSASGRDTGRCRITNPVGVTLRDIVDQHSWWSERTDLIKDVWVYFRPDPPTKAGKRPGNSPRVLS